ncbi:MAG: SDR family oxidoreductase [Dehalococcoidia bacterium]|nr:SDR family oxidoreductase [Dehalococcoidia bacterium]
MTLQDSLSLGGPPRRVAIVTGGGRGLGREMARSLVEAGADVVLASRTLAQLEDTAAFIERDTGRRPHIIPTDIQKSSECDALIDQTVEKFGRLDIMMNNAGIGDRRGAGARLWELTDEDWHDTIEVNLYGTFYCSRKAASQFIAQGGGGKIINTASIAGKQGYEPLAHYSASKFAVVALTQAAARAFGGNRINVNAICPGVTFTAILEDLLETRSKEQGITVEDMRTRIEKPIPIGRGNTPADIGAMAVFLAGPGARNITGQCYNVDGGLVPS